MDFLKTLNGVQKGDNVKGVNELKKYLAHLGYLNNNDRYRSNHKCRNKNNFDISLEFALKKYQRFYDLNITGIVDASTIAKMHEPRCGMPDFYRYEDHPFHIVSHYTLLPGRPKWRLRKLKYAFSRNVKDESISALVRAMKEWASVTPFTFFPVKISGQANVRISFLYGHHGDELPFIGPNPVGGLAHSFPPPDGRIHFDAAQNWSHGGDPNAFDIQTVGLHELGHVLGLGHSSVHKAVMHALIGPGEIKHLHEDDIKGIKSLYKLKMM